MGLRNKEEKRERLMAIRREKTVVEGLRRKCVGRLFESGSHYQPCVSGKAVSFPEPQIPTQLGLAVSALWALMASSQSVDCLAQGLALKRWGDGEGLGRRPLELCSVAG